MNVRLSYATLVVVLVAVVLSACAVGAGANDHQATPGGGAADAADAACAPAACPHAAGDAGLDARAPDSAPAVVDTTGPIGLGAITGFAELPYLRTAQRALHESSYDRTGGNNDWSVGPNYLYRDANGDKVLLDARGPGCVYRIWFTGQDPKQMIRIYFDDEPAPRVEMSLGDFFSGTKAPFLAPLVSNDQASSGGFFSDLPLTFAKAIRITATGSPPDYYFNVDYHLFDPSVAVKTWTGNEDSTAARALWSKAGGYPLDQTGAEHVSALAGIAAGQSKTILDVDGPREITAIRMSVGGVFPVHPVQLTDTGRAHKGTSTFSVKINPANDGVVLQRRLDHGIGDQSATVLVDGAPVGTWSDRGSDTVNRWRDDFFPLPASATAGKSTIQVQIAFTSSANDWNEFYYWVYSRVAGAEALTDELDVGDAASETAHGYAVAQPTYSGTQAFTYPQPIAFAQPLNDLWIRIAWDGEATPSVEAPLGAFFAQGAYGPGFVKALAAGMNADGTMYMYLPMPFARHATIAIENRSNATIDDVWYEVLHEPFADSFANVGNFKVAFAGDVASTPNKDALFVEASGAGQIVGVVESMLGPNTPNTYLYLEGDEHAFVDGRRTASLQGTGTEDFYNGGWYFDRGEFTRQTHGWAGFTTTPQTDGRAMYRFFLSDAIPFRSHVRFGIQHGGMDDVAVTSSLLAYYYARPEPRSRLTDTLSIGDAANEASHSYSVTGQTWQGSQTFTYEEPDFVQVTASGRAHKGTSRFTMAIDPKNQGVTLRRVMDYAIGRQAADVSVGGTLVGRWYTPGSNATHRWREDEFWIPKSITAGKSSIEVTIQFVSSDVDWNEFGYEAHSIFE